MQLNIILINTLNFGPDKSAGQQIQLDLLNLRMKADIQRVSATENDKLNEKTKKYANQ